MENALVNAIERERLFEYMADTEPHVRKQALELFNKASFLESNQAVIKRNKKTALWTFYLYDNQLITYRFGKHDFNLCKSTLSQKEMIALKHGVITDQKIRESLSEKMSVVSTTKRIKAIKIAENDALSSFNLSKLIIKYLNGKVIDPDNITIEEQVSVFK